MYLYTIYYQFNFIYIELCDNGLHFDNIINHAAKICNIVYKRIALQECTVYAGKVLCTVYPTFNISLANNTVSYFAMTLKTESD